MKRLYFMVPSLSMTEEIIQSIEHLGVHDSSVHVVGEHAGVLEQHHLHRANIFQTTEIGPALRWGLLLGLVFIGVIFSVFFLWKPGHIEWSASPLSIMAPIVFGILIGLWIAAMIGIAIPNRAVEKARKEVKAGHYLLIFDIEKERVTEFTELLLEKFPGVHPISEYNGV